MKYTVLSVGSIDGADIYPELEHKLPYIWTDSDYILYWKSVHPSAQQVKFHNDGCNRSSTLQKSPNSDSNWKEVKINSLEVCLERQVLQNSKLRLIIIAMRIRYYGHPASTLSARLSLHGVKSWHLQFGCSKTINEHRTRIITISAHIS
jgi:hypothetical protein